MDRQKFWMLVPEALGWKSVDVDDFVPKIDVAIQDLWMWILG